MFHIDCDDYGVAILDYTMQIISLSQTVVTRFNTVDITGQFSMESTFTGFNNNLLGTSLYSAVNQSLHSRLDALSYMARLFFNQKGKPNDELQLGILIESITFQSLNNSMIIMFNDPKSFVHTKNHIMVDIHDYNDQFNRKIANIWKFLEEDAEWIAGILTFLGFDVNDKSVVSWVPGVF